MTRRGFSPLERRALVELLSLIRETEPDPDEWSATDIRLKALYDRCYRMHPERSYELQARHQRQAMRRALGRLHKQGYVWAFALGWVNVEDWSLVSWQGGGTRKRDRHGYTETTPRWRIVGLNDTGIKAAELIELEQSGGAE